MSTSVFSKESSHYQRRLNLIEDYIEQSAYYLHCMTGDSIKDCRQFIQASLTPEQFPEMTDPVVTYFDRGENGDRVRSHCHLSQYIDSTLKANELLAPSFTTYLPSSVLRSQLSEFAEGNMKLRSIHKAKAFKAKAEGKMDIFAIEDNTQTNKKLSNNSLSGAFVTEGSILHNPTAHSTLTSTTRTVASFGNTVNERLVAGNRHYWSPDTVLFNILSTVSNTDLHALRQVINTYGLVYPTVQDVMECITYSSDLYWRDRGQLARIEAFVNRLTETERAAFVYTGDLYHLRKLNDTAIRHFLDQLSERVESVIEDPLVLVKTLDEAEMNLACHICYKLIQGYGKDYVKMYASDIINGLKAVGTLFISEESDVTQPATCLNIIAQHAEAYYASGQFGILNTLVATGLHVRQVLERYRSFIAVFFLSDNIPASSAHLKHMVRRSVLVSDTDSTCASYQEWVEWHRGQVMFDEKAMALAASVMTLATQSIVHVLAILSANIGVEPNKLHTLAMKNEFTWLLMCPTNVAKHYFASTIIQEGNVFKKPELEIKGVHLKNSSTSKLILNQAHDWIREMCQAITEGQSLSLVSYLKRIAELERTISTSLLNGELTYYRRAMIKDAAAYKHDMAKSPYQHYLLWKTVFEPCYGIIAEPPYGVIKVPTTLLNKTQLVEWINGFEDVELAERLRQWCRTFNKTTLPTLYLSTEYVRGHGILKEIKPIIDTQRVVKDLMKVYYILLESLGFYLRKNCTVKDLGY